MTLYTLAESNRRKTWLYLSFFFILIILVGWLISYTFNNVFLLWLAVFFSFFSTWLSYWHSDKIVLAMTRAKPIEKSDNPELYRLVENLCLTTGLPLPKIFIIDEAQPNAFATGRDPRHSVIAVTRGLLEKLERVELEGVIAHELAHIGNRDILLSSVVVVLVGFFAILADLMFRLSWRLDFSRDKKGEGQARLFLIGLTTIAVILGWFFAQLLRFAISRKREFLADATGALTTRYPEGLARALEKIAQDETPLRFANNATAHLFIANPFRNKKNSNWFHNLFLTHPPIEERIAALRGMKI
jgi:heat shock protein HtpX